MSPGKETFNFNARNGGKTEVIMLMLRPWENGTIAERKIFPINIMSTAVAPKQAVVLGKGVNPFQSSGGMATKTTYGTSSNSFTNESVMETPSQASSQYVADINDLSPHGKPRF